VGRGRKFQRCALRSGMPTRCWPTVISPAHPDLTDWRATGAHCGDLSDRRHRSMQPGLPHDDLLASLGLVGPAAYSVRRALMRRQGIRSGDQVAALPETAGLDVHYALIGVGEDRDYLQGLANELGVSDRLHFLGHVKAKIFPAGIAPAVFLPCPTGISTATPEGFGLVVPLRLVRARNRCWRVWQVEPVRQSSTGDWIAGGRGELEAVQQAIRQSVAGSCHGQ